MEAVLGRDTRIGHSRHRLRGTTTVPPRGWRAGLDSLRGGLVRNAARPVEQRHLRRDHDERQVTPLGPSLGHRAVSEDLIEILQGVAAFAAPVEGEDHRPTLTRFRVVASRQVYKVLATLSCGLAFVATTQ